MKGKGFKQSRKQYAPLLCTYDCNPLRYPLLILFQVLHPKSNLHYTPRNIDRSLNPTIDVSIYEKIMKLLKSPGDFIQRIPQTEGAYALKHSRVYFFLMNISICGMISVCPPSVAIHYKERRTRWRNAQPPPVCVITKISIPP